MSLTGRERIGVERVGWRGESMTSNYSNLRNSNHRQVDREIQHHVNLARSGHSNRAHIRDPR